MDNFSLSYPVSGTDMVMVPREATALMIQSGIVAHEECSEDGFGDNAMRDAWEAMLSASPSTPIPVIAEAGERVRSLVWQEPHSSHSYPNWFARDYGVGFEARIDTSKPLLYGKFPLTINGSMVAEKFDTADAAKAYAQHNYEQRILAALSTPTTLDNTAVKWRERWYGSEPQRGSAIVDERGNLIAYFGGDETTHAATAAAVAAHNAPLTAKTEKAE